MGMGRCRFDKCNTGTNKDYSVFLPDQNTELYVCGLWEHYATQHNVLPSQRAREVIMAADPTQATKEVIRWRGMQKPEQMSLYFVERTNPLSESYDHQIGDSPDRHFIDKLKTIIEKAEDKTPHFSMPTLEEIEEIKKGLV